MNETPSNLGVKRCLAWIKACEEMGWPKSAIPKLVDIFWEFKDRDGNLKGEGPTQETVVLRAEGDRIAAAIVTGLTQCDHGVDLESDCDECRTLNR